MRRRILPVILVMFMLAPYGVFASENRAEFENSEFEYAQNVMDKLKILEYSEENLEDTISRIDFAVYLARLMKINEYEMQGYTYYTDIAKNHYGLKSVNYLTEIGAFDGYGDSLFRPDDPISPIEAAKVIFNALGYRTYASLTGGYPKAYSDMSKETNLLKGFDGCKDLNRSEAAVLLLRSGLIEMAGIDLIEDDKGLFSSDEDDTVFARYWDIYEKEGIVTAVDHTDILGKDEGKEGYVIINNEMYRHDTLQNDVLARYVRALVKESDDDNNELIYVTVNDRKTNEITIDAYDIESYAEHCVEYYDNENRVKKGKIAANAVFIYNGTIAEYDIDEKINGINKGDVSLIDVNNDEEADTVIINDYKTYVVGYIDYEKELIYDEYTKAQVLALENYEHKKFYSVGGSETDMNSVSSGTVINVKESNGKYADVYVSSVMVEGIMTGVFTDDMGRKGIKIDGKEYLFDKSVIANGSWFENGEFKARPGENMNFILDMFGEVAYITGYGKGSKQIGYIISVKPVVESEEYVKIKLLKSDGSVDSFECAEKVDVDGTKYKAVDAIDNAISQGDGKVILYKLDSDGKINFIDTTYKGSNESEASLVPATPVERASWEPQDPRYPGCRQWFLKNKSFSGVITPYASTVIFDVPEDTVGKSDDYFRIVNFSSYTDGTQRKCQSYKLGEDNFYDDIIVTYTDGSFSLSTKSDMLAINSVTQEINADDEIVYKINGVSRGKAVSYLVDETCMERGFTNSANSKKFISAGELEGGDIIQFATNTKGAIHNMRLLVDYSDGADSMPDFANNTRYGLNIRGDDYSLNRVYCKNCYSGGLDLSYIKGGDVVWKANFDAGKPTVTVIDTSKKKNMVTVGSIKDILSFEMGGTQTLPMYIYSNRMFMVDVVLYK